MAAEKSFPLKLEGLDQPLRMHLHQDRDIYISAQIRELGIWEPFESSLLCRCLEPGQRFLDAGANIGYFSILAASRVGAAGQVYAFEPEPRNYRLLQHNAVLNGFEDRITAVQAALAAESGVGELFLHSENLGDHQVFADQGRSSQSIAIEMIRGADWFAEPAPALDLVKIDTQGAEQAVVAGLLPVLKASGPRLRMIVELTPGSLRAAGSSGVELIETLELLDLPFAIIDHIEHRLVPISAAELKGWCINLDSYPEDTGFMNIFLGATL